MSECELLIVNFVTIFILKIIILQSFRYFTETQAIEYYIPTSRLRYSDPLTGIFLKFTLFFSCCFFFVIIPYFLGDKILPSGVSESELIQKYQSVKPIKFDMKGNYGVSIVWSDGHYADIFPFDILKKIGVEGRS